MVTNTVLSPILGVVGAGAMGAGIAQVGLAAGLTVVLSDANEAALANAREQILARLERAAHKGQLSPSVVPGIADRLVLARNLADLAPANLVVEAIVEKLEAKQGLFAALENVVSPEAVLATNTSSLSVSAIGRGCARRERVCGMHFFNPVPAMRLVEIISGAETSVETMRRAMEMARGLGKTAVRVRDVPGFLVNLLGRAYTTEALHIRHEGVATEAQIDQIMREAAGFRMGPFELMDLTGIDVNFPATSYIHQGFQSDPRLKTTIQHEALYNAGRFGRKTAQGFHRYAEGQVLGLAAPARPDVEAPLEPMSVHVEDIHPGFGRLQMGAVTRVVREAADAILVSPVGEDASSVCARLGVAPDRVVAVDFTGEERRFLTLMVPVAGGATAQRLAHHLRRQGYAVVVIKDSPGFVAPRILSMVANLGCEVAQVGIAEAPEDIDMAMKLAQNYPKGPLEWGDHLGAPTVLETLQHLQQITGSDRYRPSLWLRRRAQLRLPIRAPN